MTMSMATPSELFMPPRSAANDAQTALDCRISLLDTGVPVPLVIEPLEVPNDACQWYEERRSFFARKLLEHGAILFRNCGIDTVDKFHAFVSRAAGELMEYKERTSPRSQVAERIYTSTDYPSNQHIAPHNEHSYSLTFPSALAFWCDTPADTGGETPLGDTRRVFARIDPAVREKFERLGWMYVRNFDGMFGLPWQRVFQTDSREEVEAYCRSGGISCEWRAGNRLRTSQVRPAVIRHPVTGDVSWFNHATFFHISTLPASIQAFFKRDYREADYPNNTYYGDGTRIDDATAEHLREAYRREMVPVAWRKHDLTLVDNILTAHARHPFSGPRRILAALVAPITRRDT
jgi:alpha-ketoglutarate-dependent taurine dioxygenase